MTGGVGDYTQRVAQALARHGEDVHVWTLSGREIPRVDEAVTVHAFPDTFGPRTWAMLARGLLAERGPGRLLVQYVPQAFGFRGMNVGMCSALALQRHHELWTMFHEVATPTAALRHVRPNVLALVTRGMALMLARSSRRMFVSIPGWNDVLARFVPGFEPAMWLPIPSNVEASATSARVEEVRAALAAADRGDAPAGAGGFVVGHFGTYGSLITPLLEPALCRILSDERATVLLLGRGSTEFAASFVARTGTHSRRVMATGALPPEEIAAHLLACNVALQPFPDGISSRRTSVMASVALGVPVVTNQGFLTESIWRDSGAVALVSAPASALADALAQRVFDVVAEPRERFEIGVRAKALYEQRFRLDRVIETLQGAEEQAWTRARSS